MTQTEATLAFLEECLVANLELNDDISPAFDKTLEVMGAALNKQPNSQIQQVLAHLDELIPSNVDNVKNDPRLLGLIKCFHAFMVELVKEDNQELHIEKDSKPVEVVESMDNIAKVIGLEGGETVPHFHVESLCYEAFMFMRDNFDQYSIKLRDVFKYLSLKYRDFSSSDFTAWKEDVENIMNSFVCIDVKENVNPETGEEDHTYTLDSNRIYRISEAGTLQFRELAPHEVADQKSEEAERQQTWDGRDLREAFEGAIDPPLVASNQGRTENRRSSMSNANDEMGALGGSLSLVVSTTVIPPRFSNSRESYLKKERIMRRNPQYKSVASRMLKYDRVEMSLLTVPNFDHLTDCEGIQCVKMERDEKLMGKATIKLEEPE